MSAALIAGDLAARKLAEALDQESRSAVWPASHKAMLAELSFEARRIAELIGNAIRATEARVPDPVRKSRRAPWLKTIAGGVVS